LFPLLLIFTKNVKEKKPKPKRSIAKRVFRFVLKSVFILVLLFVFLILFIRSPWGQNLIIDKVTQYVSDEIGTPFQIKKFYLTFQGNVAIDGIYLEDQAKDTLLYSKNLEIDVPILPILTQQKISIQNLDWSGLVANVKRSEQAESFNYQYIIDAFATEEEPTEEPSAYTFDVNNINFKDFKLSYTDELEGLETNLNLGELNLAFQKFNLENLDFQLKQLQIVDTEIVYQQKKQENLEVKVEDEVETSSTEKLPLFQFNEVIFQNVSLNYSDENNGIKINSKLNDFQLNEGLADLNADEFKLDKFLLADSFIEVQLPAPNSSENAAAQTESSFEWPAYFVQLNELELANNRFQFVSGNQKIESLKFNDKAIEVNDFQLSLADFVLEKKEKASFHLETFSFKESSGFQLQQLGFDFKLNSKQLEVNSFAFQTQKNSIKANAKLQFNSLKQWIKTPEKFQNINFNLDADLDPSEFYSVYPDLENTKYLKEVSKHPLVLKVDSNGNLNQLNLEQFNLKWAATQLVANGTFRELSDLDKLTYAVDKFNFSSPKKDFLKFVQLDQYSFNLPAKINLTGYAKGDLSSVKTETVLQIPEGKLKLFADIQQKNKITLNTKLELTQMDLGKIIIQPKLKPISLVLTANAEGTDWLELKGKINSKFEALNYADFDLSDLDFSGEIENKNASIKLGLSHDDLRFTTVADLVLDSIQPQVDLVFHLEGADFRSLGFTPKDIRARTKLSAHFSGNADQFEFNSTIDSTLVVYDNETYEVKKIELNANVSENKTEFTSNSGFLNSTLQANSHPKEWLEALQAQYDFYWSDQNQFRETELPVELNWNMKFHSTPFISEVIFSGLEEVDTLSFDIAFMEKSHQLDLEVSLPRLVYNENELDSLALSVHNKMDKADFSFGFENLKASVLEISKTRLYGDFEGEQLSLNFEAFKADEEFFNINTLFTLKEDDIVFSVLPEKLILNKKPWDISVENYIKYIRRPDAKELLLNAFELTRNTQYIGFKNDFNVDKTHVGILFENFKLSTLTSYLNNKEDFIKGIVSGDLIVINPFEQIGIISDLKIDNLELMQNPIGQLSLNAKSDLNDSYQLDLALSGEQIQLQADGKIDNSTGTPFYTFQADLKKLQMQLVEKFAEEYIAYSKGQISAHFDLNGNPDDLDFKGNLSFSETKFKVKKLNAIFKLGDEKIEFDKEKIAFNTFRLMDVNNNAFSIDGKIGIEDLLNPSFNLTAKANNFEALNSTKKDNDLYYGKVNFNADFKLLGDLNFPKIEGDLAFLESTNFTYLVPQTQVGTVEREGVVAFVNKKNPDDILTRKEEDRFNAVIAGIEINTLLKINPKAKVKVVFNQKTGDNVELEGGGDLKFKMARNGNMTLFGKYEARKGKFEFNFYNLVTRSFQIAEGSTINWTGDPLNADLDIRAIYNIETSASLLMASQTSSESPLVKNQFRQQLPFEVYLDVGGEINAPELNFQLDMPETSRGAINGSVYNRVMQINQQGNELNKQVFSLLVLNRFYPNSGSDGSQGGAASIARNNINQALSDQLNTFSNKLTGNTGIQLNFDVNSYTDFQSGQANNRTDVDISAQKKLLNDRLVVEAGSQVNVEGDLRPGESNVALGNVSVQYLITQDGRWKIKGFRRSEYENVIDGQVFISGIALIFTREFNHFKELWEARNKKDEEEKLDETADETADENEEDSDKPSQQNNEANLPTEEQDHE